jgi:hypothetical protein
MRCPSFHIGEWFALARFREARARWCLADDPTSQSTLAGRVPDERFYTPVWTNSKIVQS